MSKSTSSEERPTVTPKEMKARAARGFALRVTLLVLAMVGVAYVAWFAPWSKPAAQVAVESAR